MSQETERGDVALYFYGCEINTRKEYRGCGNKSFSSKGAREEDGSRLPFVLREVRRCRFLRMSVCAREKCVNDRGTSQRGLVGLQGAITF